MKKGNLNRHNDEEAAFTAALTAANGKEDAALTAPRGSSLTTIHIAQLQSLPQRAQKPTIHCGHAVCSKSPRITVATMRTDYMVPTCKSTPARAPCLPS